MVNVLHSDTGSDVKQSDQKRWKQLTTYIITSEYIAYPTSGIRDTGLLARSETRDPGPILYVESDTQYPDSIVHGT